jgi:putative membrane protein
MPRRLIAIMCACLVASAVLAGGASAQRGVSGLDKEYLKTSIQGDRFEITGGRVALTKTRNAAVVRLAERLIADHTKSLRETAALARRLGVEVPRTPAPTQIWALRVLSTFSGRTFAYWYSSGEVYDHLQDIDETSDEIRDGSNSAVRADARTNLPVLRLHLKLARIATAASR